MSGFGLAGHLDEMLRASGVSAAVDVDRLPHLPGVPRLLRAGLRSSFHEQNARRRTRVAVAPERAGDPLLDLLYDPQTSGGLLFAVDSERLDAVLRELRAQGDRDAVHIGDVGPPRDDGTTIEARFSGPGAT